MRWLKIKNWSEFQHYKDRNPPWIKLHRAVLDDYEFSCLQDASKAHLMLIWVFASQHEGRIPDDPCFLMRKLGLIQAPDLNELINHGFLIVEQSAIQPLAECKQNAPLGRGYKATDKATDIQSSPSDSTPEKVPAPTTPVWDSYADAYETRYRQRPPRNAKANGILKQLLARLGAVEAPAVAAFYVKHPGAFYATRGHPLDCLLADAEKLRMEWANGQTITAHAARQNERTAANPFVKFAVEEQRQEAIASVK